MAKERRVLDPKAPGPLGPKKIGSEKPQSPGTQVKNLLTLLDPDSFREALASQEEKDETVLYSEGFLKFLFLTPSDYAPRFVQTLLAQFESPNFVYRNILTTFLSTTFTQLTRYEEETKPLEATIQVIEPTPLFPDYTESKESLLVVETQVLKPVPREKKLTKIEVETLRSQPLSFLLDHLSLDHLPVLDKGWRRSSEEDNLVGDEMQVVLSNGPLFLDVLVKAAYPQRLFEIKKKDTGLWLAEVFKFYRKTKVPVFREYAMKLLQLLFTYGVSMYHPFVFNFARDLFESYTFEECVHFLRAILEIEFDLNVKVDEVFWVAVDAAPGEKLKGDTRMYTNYSMFALSVIYGRVDLVDWLLLQAGPITVKGEDYDVPVCSKHLNVDQTVNLVTDAYPVNDYVETILVTLPVSDLEVSRAGYNDRVDVGELEVDLVYVAGLEGASKVRERLLDYSKELEKVKNFDDPFTHDISQLVIFPCGVAGSKVCSETLTGA